MRFPACSRCSAFSGCWPLRWRRGRGRSGCGTGLDVLRCVLGQYALPFGAGAAFGVAVAAAAAKVLRNILFGFIPFDLVSFGAGLLLFAAVALASSIAPVRRALRIDPASALRYEG